MILNYGDMLGGALASGLNTGMQMGQLVDQRRQREAAQLQQQEAEARQQAALQQASQLYSQGTPDQIAEFALQNPEAGQLLQRQMQFKSDATKQNMMSGMRDIMTNPGKTEDILKNRIAMVEEAGGDASDTIADLAHFQQDPESYRQTVEKSYAMMDPSGYAQYKKMTTQEAPRFTNIQYNQQGQPFGINSETGQFERIGGDFVRAMQQEQMTPYQQVQTKLREQELALKQKQQAEKTAENRSQKQIDMNSSYHALNDTVNLVDNILNNDALEEVSGWNALLPTGFGTDVAGIEAQIETLQSQNFLNAVQKMKGSGSLSDAEGKKLSSTIASLKFTMPDEEFRNSLNTIKNITKRGMRNMEQMYDKMGIEKPELTNVYSNKPEVKQIAPNEYSSGGIIFREVK